MIFAYYRTLSSGSTKTRPRCHAGVARFPNLRHPRFSPTASLERQQAERAHQERCGSPNIDWRASWREALRQMVYTYIADARPFAAPPNVPETRLKLLRDASRRWLAISRSWTTLKQARSSTEITNKPRPSCRSPMQHHRKPWSAFAKRLTKGPQDVLPTITGHALICSRRNNSRVF